MSDYDGLVDEDAVVTSKAVDMDAPVVSEAEKKGLTREQAIEAGREGARLECVELTRRRPDVYTRAVVERRIERAGEYAAWEYDGRQARTIGRK